jgi:exodeoxyribonuclease VII small subunit
MTGDLVVFVLILVVAGAAGSPLVCSSRRDSPGGPSLAVSRIPRSPVPIPTEPDQNPAARPDPSGMTFDEALAELQRTVAALEAGGQPLEASIALYERGVALHERCAALLADAELRVKRLVERAGGAIDALELKPDEDVQGD